MWTNDLRTTWSRLGRPALPSLPAVTQHHALDDARECQYRRRRLARHELELATSTALEVTQ
jgi:hypothetical protein